jgi:hypothetical protein
VEGLMRVGGPWYPGRPVMIIKNDHGIKKGHDHYRGCILST